MCPKCVFFGISLILNDNSIVSENKITYTERTTKIYLTTYAYTWQIVDCKHKFFEKYVQI